MSPFHTICTHGIEAGAQGVTGESGVKSVETVLTSVLTLIVPVAGAVLPGAALPLDKALQKVAEYRANKEIKKLSTVLGVETDSIDDFADTMARMMADMCRGQKLDKPSLKNKWKKFMKDLKGKSFGENDEETYLRLLAAEHVVQAVHWIAEDEIQRQKNNTQRPINDDQSKVQPALRWHREQHWPGYNPEALKNNFVWGELDSRHNDDDLKMAVEVAKKRRKKNQLEQDKRIESIVAQRSALLIEELNNTFKEQIKQALKARDVKIEDLEKNYQTVIKKNNELGNINNELGNKNTELQALLEEIGQSSGAGRKTRGKRTRKGRFQIEKFE